MKYSILLIVTILGLAMSGGIHRVAQSRFATTPHATGAAEGGLNMFFSLDNTLKAGKYLRVVAPSGAATWGTSRCAVWVVGTTLASPLLTTDAAWVGGSNMDSNNFCTFTVDLAANTAYGVQIIGASANVGVWAPVALSTHGTNSVAANIKGPKIDGNPVFDSVAVLLDPVGTFTLEATLPTGDGVTTNQPGDNYLVDWQFTFSGFTAGQYVKAPFNFVLNLAPSSDRDGSTVVTTPKVWTHDYDNWVWGSVCTNTQFGPDVTGTDVLKTLATTVLGCTSNAAGDLTIVMTEDLLSDNWATFEMHVTVEITLPKDLIGSVAVTSKATTPAGVKLLGGSTLSSAFAVVKPTGTTMTGKTWVSFGVDPTDSGNKGRGVGLYSNNYCGVAFTQIQISTYSAVTTVVVSARLVVANPVSFVGTATVQANTGPSNCSPMAAGTSAAQIIGMEIDLPNAVELVYKTPYAIPDDRTFAEISCSTEQVTAGSSDCTTAVPTDVTTICQSGNKNFWVADPLEIYQQSVMASGFGAGNCWYYGRDPSTLTSNAHNFRCNDIGALAANAEMSLSFQFSIRNQGKSAGTDGRQDRVVTALTCAMNLKTKQGDGSSALTDTLWYTQSLAVPVDGGALAGTDDKFAEYSGFFVRATGVFSYGQATLSAAGAVMGAGTGTTEAHVDVRVTLQLSPGDVVEDAAATVTAGIRQMPFDVSAGTVTRGATPAVDVNNKKLYQSLYGKAAVQGNSARVVPTISTGAGSMFRQLTETYANQQAIVLNALDWSALAKDTDASTTGLLQFKQVAWAGGCINTKINVGDQWCPVAEYTDLHMFKWNTWSNNVLKKVSHSGIITCGDADLTCYTADSSGKTTTESVTELYLKFSQMASADTFFTMPVTTMTTVRGRGGFGAQSGQHVVQRFFKMWTDDANANGYWSTLLHTYVFPTTTMMPTNLFVAPTFPLWVAENTGTDSGDAAGEIFLNTGSLALNVMKLYVAAAAVPLGTHYGFPMPRGQPFMHADGGNKIRTVAGGARAVDCWMYGNEFGNGYCVQELLQAAAPYKRLRVFKGMNFLVCNVGVAAGTAVTGDVVVIPFMQQQGKSGDVGEMYVPGMVYGTADGAGNSAGSAPSAASRLDLLYMATPKEVIACLAISSTTYVFVAGSDKYLGEMTFITDATNNESLWQLYASAASMFPKTANIFGDIATAYTDSTGPLEAQRNDNDATTANQLRLFDVKNLAAAAGLDMTALSQDATLIWSNAASGNTDWAVAGSVWQVCTPVTGNVLAGATVAAQASAAANNVACSAAFPYRVDEGNPTLLTYTATTALRSCVFCTGTNQDKWTLTAFTPPSTTDRLATGFDIWGSDQLGVCSYTGVGDKAATIYVGAAIAAACSVKSGKGSATTIGYKGQVVTFSLPNVVNLAGGQYVYWKAGTVNFQASAAVTDAGVFSCNSRTWSQHAYTLTGTLLTVALPAVSAADDAGTYQAANTVQCPAGGDVKFAIRQWNDAQTIGVANPVAESTGCQCYADAATGASVANTNIMTANDNCNFTFPAPTATAAMFLSVLSPTFEPGTIGSQGRFHFKPVSSWHNPVKGYTEWKYNFGSNVVWDSDDCVCQVMTSDSSGVHSNDVATCEVTGSNVNVVAGLTGSVNYVVVVLGSTTWAGVVADKVTGDFKSFGETVYSAAAGDDNKLTLQDGSNTPATSTTVVLSKSGTSVMDVGSVTLTFTLTVLETWDKSGRAVVDVPKSYRPDVGENVRCQLFLVDALLEELYCEMQWDWSLKVWGPRSNSVAKAVAHKLVLSGVEMSTSNTKNWQVGFSNTSSTASYNEFGVAIDTANVAFLAGQGPIAVMDFTSSSKDTRGSTNLMMYFNVPVTSGTVMAASDYMTVTLPQNWGKMNTMNDGSWTGTATLTKDVWDATVTPATNTVVALAVTVTMLAPKVIKVTPDVVDPVVTFAENTNYTLTLNGVPTPSEPALGATGSVVLSLGKTTAGVLGLTGSTGAACWSVALPNMAVKSTMKSTKLSAASATVSRGTYSMTQVCASPNVGAFGESVSFSATHAVVSLNPATLTAKLGDANVCGQVGVAATAQLSSYLVYWTKVDGAGLLNLPALTVKVVATKAKVNVAATVTCSMGGKSVPILVTSDATPHTDVKVSMVVVPPTDPIQDPYPSAGLTPDTTVVTLSLATPTGVLGFGCDATAAGTQLNYVLAGTDLASFELSAASATVSPVAAGTKVANPLMTIAMLPEGDSTASAMKLTGLCPALGEGWMFLYPVVKDKFSATAPAAQAALTSLEAVKSAAAAAAADLAGGKKAADIAQSCHAVIASDATTPVGCTFATKSLGSYNALLYCQSIDNHFYASATAKNLTALDNGGKTFKMKLTYGKAIDVKKDNVLVNKLLCAVSKGLMVTADRVADSLGGVCGKPSALLEGGAKAPAVVPAANTTTAANTTNATAAANTTRLLTNATANATTPAVQTAWVLNLFVMPDPYATTYDTDTVAGSAAGLTTQIDAVTSATHGTAAVATETVTEVAVKFAANPTATGAKDSVTVAGKTDVAGYAVCWVAKVGTPTVVANATTRLLTNATNATNATTTSATSAAAPAPAAVSTADWEAKQNFQRQATVTPGFAFSLVWTAKEGMKYDWGCLATSMHPSNPKFVSAPYTSTVTTPAVVVTETKAEMLWMTMIVMVFVAVFFL